MSCSSGPGVVTSGLVLDLDAGNKKSSKYKTTLINWDTWTLGTGSVTGYSENGVAQSSRITGTDPWGFSNTVWSSAPNGVSGPNGGWNGTAIPADMTKTYRFSVWVKRSSATATGSYYFGLYTNGTNSTIMLAGGVQANPYWDIAAISSLTQNQWYLAVGFIFPYNYTGTTAHPDSGLYTTASTTKVRINAGNAPSDVKFPPNATTMWSRCYHFYCTDITSSIQFFQPRIDLVDGNEPTISQLLNNTGSLIYDVSGGVSAGTLTNGPTYSSSNDGSLVFDGVNDVVNINYTTALTRFSISIWAYPTGYTGVYPAILADKFISSINYCLICAGYWQGGMFQAGTWYYSPTAVMTLNTWQHVTYTYDGTTQGIYLNGVYIGGTITYSGNPTCSGSGLRLGQRWDLADMYAGRLSRLQIYNRALTATEVKQNFNATRGRYGI
jgi:hypothetical protein